MKIKMLKEYVSPATGVVSSAGQEVEMEEDIALDLIATGVAEKHTPQSKTPKEEPPKTK